MKKYSKNGAAGIFFGPSYSVTALAVAVNVLEETAREYLIQLGSLGMTVTGWKRKQFFKLHDLQ